MSTTEDLELADDIEERPAEMVVPTEGSNAASVASRSGGLTEFLSRPPHESRFKLSKEQIDQLIQAERDSWE